MTGILEILIRDPEPAILDKPTSALARKEVEQLYQAIHNLTADDKTITFIPYRSEELFELGGRVIILRGGCYIGTRNMDEINGDSLIRTVAGRSLNRVSPSSVCEAGDGQVILEVENLTDINHKLNQVGFQVHEGEILRVVGLQGHGQTELLNAANGLYPLSGGFIIVNGKQVGIKNAG